MRVPHHPVRVLFSKYSKDELELLLYLAVDVTLNPKYVIKD